MAFLRADSGNREFPVFGKLTTIGRDPSCDIVVNSPMVSGQHVLIISSCGARTVEDLDSRNGTFLNGERLSDRRTLHSGDRIELIGICFTFCEDRLATSSEPLRSTSAADVGPRTPRGSTIQLAEVMDSEQVDVISAIEVIGDVRLAVKPESKLRAVLQISHVLSDSLELKRVLDQILESLFAIFPQADCGFVLLRDEKTGELAPGAIRFRDESPDNQLCISRGIVRQALMSGCAILSADAGTDSRFASRSSVRRLEIRSMMCVPIFREGGVCQGVIQIDSRDKANLFQQDDLDLLACTSLFASRAVEVARSHEARRAMEAATQIQQSFLPTDRPVCTGLDFFDHYSPAENIGGDYYDYILLPGNRVAVAIGDVAGKDLGAALLMARLSAAVRVCLTNSTELAGAVRQLNVLLTRAGGEDRFITFAVAVVDLGRSLVTIVNAGHLPPLLRRADQHVVDEVDPNRAGLPLGVMDQQYEEIQVQFHPGDSLLLYTDGISEMRNAAGELYGVDRIRAAIQSAPADAATLGTALLDNVRSYAGERPVGDDLTVVCIVRTRE